jgi:hypothetical protein
MSHIVRFSFSAGVACALAAVGGILAGDAQVQVLDSFHKSELISLPSFNGAASLGGGSGSFTGQGSPPRVGDNVQVNEVQVAPPGLLGRSETSIVADRGGQRLVAGWNDADGFVGLQPGLSGFGFSRDGGKTWIDVAWSRGRRLGSSPSCASRRLGRHRTRSRVLCLGVLAP